MAVDWTSGGSNLPISWNEGSGAGKHKAMLREWDPRAALNRISFDFLSAKTNELASTTDVVLQESHIMNKDVGLISSSGQQSRPPSTTRLASFGASSPPVEERALKTNELQLVEERILLFTETLEEADPEICGDSPPSQATSTRAIGFVRKTSQSFVRLTGAPPPEPVISPGPDSSVDIVWRFGERVLAANVPDQPGNIVTIYGRELRDDAPRINTEDETMSDGFWALAWLTR